jgi:hypothetical protein
MLALTQRRALGDQDGGRAPVARGPSVAERKARGAIEAGVGHRLTEKEWAEHKRRLLEFCRTLARWDSAQPSGAPPSETTQ